jgi:hypothetical protein
MGSISIRLFRLISVLLLTIAATGTVTAQTPEAVPATEGQLIVADPAAAAIYIYSTPGHELIGTLEETTLNDHAGFLVLPDQRLLYVDSVSNELVAVQLNAQNGPAVVGRVPVPAGVSHFAVDPSATYAVVGSASEHAPLNLVDLRSYTIRPIDVEAGEAGVMIGSDPLTLFHRNDVLSQVESYPIDAIVTGSTTPTGVVPTGAFGHGEAISHSLGKLVMATDDGLDIVAIDGDRLAYETTLPWEASGREGGRAYFMRLTADGSTAVSYIADRGETDPWGEWKNDLYLADLVTHEVTRVELGNGIVYRFGLANDSAIFFTQHPDGDRALIVDLKPGSATYGEIVSTIPLPALSAAPGPDDDPWTSESRIATISPDGSLGYISAGGDGQILVIDIATGEIVDTIATPSSLHRGGYILATQPGASFADTIGR